jgi:hypothetical protein
MRVAAALWLAANNMSSIARYRAILYNDHAETSSVVQNAPSSKFVMNPRIAAMKADAFHCQPYVASCRGGMAFDPQNQVLLVGQ